MEKYEKQKNKITFEELLELFRKGDGVDETIFYFNDDLKEEEHYIGYIPQYGKPYWAGYCDIKDGCEFKTADDLFNAKIYDNRSIKERWEQLEIVAIGGIDIDDWFEYGCVRGPAQY